MDIVSSGITAISLLLSPLERFLFYSRNFEKRARTLLCEMEELTSKENDIRAEISIGLVNQRKKLRTETQLWLKNVENLIHEVKRMETKITRNKRCMKGCFPNYRSRYRLNKMMIKRINEMRELHAKGVFSNGLFVDSFPNTRRILPTSGVVGDKTFQRVSKVIWELLTDANTSRIGIYGMGGVGKTSVMMHIYNKLIDCKDFDRVIWVNVSKTLNVEKLQIDIANATNLELSEEENVIWRSTRLLEHLQGKKFVLILDDMWHTLSLEEVGIPQPTTSNGCKFVVITRLMEVCRGMETQREIKVELLSKNEAWDLFTTKSGPICEEIEPIAKAVCENCGRLPLAIITVGRAMRKIDDERLWKNALEELETSKAEISGMEEDVFARLKFSYLHLKDDHIQACFLYCALYPEDDKIKASQLIEYWMAEELITEVGDREKEINKGYTVLKTLKDACLLEDIGSDHVKMHDLVRDMAIRIAREGPRLINKAAMKLNKLERKWIENVKWVSLMDNNITVVPDNPNCQKLSTLLLQRNPLSEKIQDSFFLKMKCLKVLDLSGTGIKSLPESVSSLCNLRSLLLSFSKIKELPSLTMLSELRVLDLSHSSLRKLPDDIDKLNNLRRLDLSYTEKLHTFPSGAIQKLSCLENFSMFKSNWRWSSIRVDFDEISSLSRLTSLGLSFQDQTSFIDYVKSKEWVLLESYHLGIGQLNILLPTSQGIITRSIEIQDCNLVHQDTIIELPNNIQQLALHSCHDITILSKLSDLENLRQCYISNCNGMEFITKADNFFPNLQLLVLRKLPNLKAICNGVATSQVFTKLKSLQIHSCNNIKYLFSSGMLQDFQNLEEIEVWNSKLIEEMVEEETGGIFSDIVLPKLRRLSLSTLPELKYITKRVLICDSVETVEIWDCEMLRALPFSITYFPSSLNNIRGNRNWWDRLQWDDINCKNLLQPFFDQGT
ncbi:hypothetical protein LXL04_038946 [Taraxacum kok-saghyz]